MPILILIHGAGGSSDVWPYQLRRLPGWRVLAVDLPGHGSSQTPGQRDIKAYAARLLEWLAGMEIKQTVLAGHSMGAAIAIEMAMAQPELFAQLILLGGAERFPVNSQLLEKLAVPVHIQEAINQIVKWSFAKTAGKARRKDYFKQLSGNPPDLLSDDFRACAAFDPGPGITHLSRPTLILAGEEDSMIPPRFSQELAARLPRAQFRSISGAGHMLMQEKPEEIVTAIEAFLQVPNAV